MDNQKKVKEFTLALGEVSGHHHTLYGDIVVEIDNKDFKKLNVEETILKHQEHDIIVVKDNETISTSIQHEFNPFTNLVTKVLD